MSSPTMEDLIEKKSRKARSKRKKMIEEKIITYLGFSEDILNIHELNHLEMSIQWESTYIDMSTIKEISSVLEDFQYKITCIFVRDDFLLLACQKMEEKL